MEAEADAEAEEEEEDYMELYVQKELKDKIEPLQELFKAKQEESKTLVDKVEQLNSQIVTVDKHYNGIVKAILSRHGIVLHEINEFNILQEYKRVMEKEEKAKERLKRDHHSLSPPRNDRTNKDTEYVIKLAKNARER